MAPLAPGHKLGPYEILAPIGAGGMGEVYRARDTRLGRDVAIKLSKEQFSERFEREARAAAALNHPNICQLYDVGPNYLVMEFIEGETLQGPLPLDATLDYARQIAEALEAAHEKGITHRDLKPANIKITHQGVVKILDFGLAAVAQTSATPSDVANSPTLTVSPTIAGMILGTAAYMPPEQARGKPVDKRADIWAFGCVFFEMLTGRRLFQGSDVSEILASVIKDQPDLSALPAELRPTIEKCLRKDPRLRWRDIGDVRIALEEAPASAAPTLAVQQPKQRTWLWPSIAIALLTGLAALVFIHFREQPPVAQAVRFTVPAPEKLGFGGWMTISPDGRTLAFTALGTDSSQGLWLRPLDSLEAHRLNGTSGTVTGFWSPDSRFLVFQSAGKLKKIDVSGGLPQTLCDAPGVVLGGSWNRDGVILFGRNNDGVIMRVASTGGTPAALTVLDRSREEINHSDPVFLPDGKHFLYLRRAASADNSGVFVGSLESRPEQQSLKMILSTSFSIAFVPSPNGGAVGSLFFRREGSLMMQPFDAQRLELAGEAVPIADQVGGGLSRSFFAVSPSGVLAYRSGGDLGNYAIYDREGGLVSPIPLSAVNGLTELALSKDGALLAFSRAGQASRDIWVLDLARSVSRRFSFNPDGGEAPIWSPDGKYIAYVSSQGTVHNLYRKASSGAGSEELLLSSKQIIHPNDWSSDGRYLLYSIESDKGPFELWLLPDPGGPAGMQRKSIPYLQTRFNTTTGQFSPDSRFVAYMSTESGRPEIYVRPFPLSAERSAPSLISSSGGMQPRWRHDGKELYFVGVDNRLMSVDVALGAQLRAGNPQPRFVVSPSLISGNLFRYDALPDGQRFVTVGIVGSTAPAPITVILNWRADLKK